MAVQLFNQPAHYSSNHAQKRSIFYEVSYTMLFLQLLYCIRLLIAFGSQQNYPNHASITYNLIQTGSTQNIITNMKPGTLIFQLCLLLGIFLDSQSYIFENVRVIAQNTTITATTNYIFTLNQDIYDNGNPVLPTSLMMVTTLQNITITFPEQYKNINKMRCISFSVNDSPKAAYSCVNISNTIIVRNFLDADLEIRSMTLKISNVVNPSPSGITNDFKGTIGDNIATGGGTTTLEPGAFAICQATFQSVTGNSNGPIQFYILSEAALPTTSYYTIKFPNDWTGDVSNTPLIFPQAQSCSSNDAASINCEGFQNSQINVYSGILENSVVSIFNLQNIRAPPTNQELDVITITSYSNDDRAYYSCTTYPKGVEPREISSIQFIPKTTAYTNTGVQFDLKIQVPGNVTRTDIISINFFSDYWPSFSYNNAISGDVSLLNATDISLTLSTTKDFTNNGQIFLTTGFFMTPPSISPISPFTVQIFRNGYYLMKGQFTITTEIGILENFTVTPSNPNILQTSEYTLTFDYDPGVTSYGSIRVYFPEEFVPLPSSLQAYMGTKLLDTVFINQDSGVQLTNLNNEAGTISLLFKNLTNPARTQVTLNFSVVVYYNATKMDEVARISSSENVLTFTAIDNGLTFSVTSSSDVAGEQNVTMTFQIYSTVPFEIGDQLQISAQFIPLYQEGLGVNQTLSKACVINNNLIQNCYYLNDKLFIQFTLFLPQNIPFIVVIQNFYNNPVLSGFGRSIFTIRAITNDSTELVEASSVTLEKMTEIPRFEQFYVTRSNQTQFVTNLELADYTFTLTQTSSLLPVGVDGITRNNFLYLQFPSEFDFTSAVITPSQCKKISNSPVKIACTLSQISIKSYQINIQNLKNAPSTRPLNNIKASSQNSVNFYAQSLTLDNQITNIYPSQLDLSYSSFSPEFYNQLTTFSFTIDSFSSETQFATIQLFGFMLPDNVTDSCVGVDASVCTFEENFTIPSLTINFSLIDISNGFSLSVELMAPPNQNQLNDLVIYTFTADGYLISEATIPIFSHDCTLPCKTCTGALCSSCYDDLAVTNNIYFYAPTSQCLSLQTCNGDRFTNPQSLTCEDCDTFCEKCSINATYCSECKQNYFLLDNQCLEDCPDGYYKDTDINFCESCNIPCRTCTQISVCTSCVDNYYLMVDQNKCLSGCPSGVMVPDKTQPLNQTCVNCSDNCVRCFGQFDNCTTCLQAQALFEGTCYYQCPSGYILKGICVDSCSSPCLTCSIYATNCTRCGIGFYFYSNRCLTLCPTYYYQDTNNNLCAKCEDAGIHCDNCDIDGSGVFSCFNCDPGYVLFRDNYTCLQAAPEGYVNISGVAQQCLGDCLTCQNSQYQCLTCKNDKYFFNKKCLSTCPDSHYQFDANETDGGIDGQCLRCQSPCQTCSNFSDCLSCDNQTYLQPDTPQCKQDCPPSYYSSEALRLCRSCKAECKECLSYLECTVCQSNLYLIQGQCLGDCSQLYPHYVENTSTYECEPCQSPCSTCFGDISFCLSCVSDYLYFDETKECLEKCPEGYIENSKEQICTNCTYPCLICTQTTCSRCAHPYKLFEFQCVEDCLGEYYQAPMSMIQSLECVLCPTECYSCLNQTFCLTCNQTYYWLYSNEEGICVEDCPEDRPIKEDDTCNPCTDIECEQCFPNDECYNCSNITILWKGGCIYQCPAGYFYNQSIETCDIEPPPYVKPVVPEQVIVIPGPGIGRIFRTFFPLVFTAFAGVATLLSIPLLAGNLLGQNIVKTGLWSFIWGFAHSGSLGIAYYSYYEYFHKMGLWKNPYGYLLITLLSTLIILNIVTFFLNYFMVMRVDFKYRKWRQKASCKSIMFLYIAQVFILLHYSSVHLIWSNFRGMPKLFTPTRLKFIGIINTVALIFCLGYAVMFVFLFFDLRALFYVWLDLLVCFIFVVILSGCAQRKPSNFYDESIDGMPLHKRQLSSDILITPALKASTISEIFNPRTDKSLFSYDQQSSSANESSFGIEADVEESSSSNAESANIVESSLHSSRLSIGSLQSFLSPKLTHRQSRVSSKKSAASQSFTEQQVMLQKQLKQMSLQCSILASQAQQQQSKKISQDSHSSQIQCIYENSGSARRGSFEQEQSWNGIPMKPIQYCQGYDLNEAVYLDENEDMIADEVNDVQNFKRGVLDLLEEKSQRVPEKVQQNFIKPENEQEKQLKGQESKRQKAQEQKEQEKYPPIVQEVKQEKQLQESKQKKLGRSIASKFQKQEQPAEQEQQANYDEVFPKNSSIFTKKRSSLPNCQQETRLIRESSYKSESRTDNNRSELASNEMQSQYQQNSQAKDNENQGDDAFAFSNLAYASQLNNRFKRKQNIFQRKSDAPLNVLLSRFQSNQKKEEIKVSLKNQKINEQQSESQQKTSNRSQSISRNSSNFKEEEQQKKESEIIKSNSQNEISGSRKEQQIQEAERIASQNHGSQQITDKFCQKSEKQVSCPQQNMSEQRKLKGQELEQPQSQEQIEPIQEFDRFDNSVISGHNGSLPSQEQAEGSQDTHKLNNDGSLEQAKQIEQKNLKEHEKWLQQLRIIEEKRRKQREEEQKRRIEEEKRRKEEEFWQSSQEENPDEIPNIHHQDIHDEHEPTRWQNLLKQEDDLMLNNLSSIEINRTLEKDASLQDLERQMISNMIDEHEQLQISLEQELQKQLGTGRITQQQAEFIRQKSKINLRESRMLLSRLISQKELDDDQYLWNRVDLMNSVELGDQYLMPNGMRSTEQRLKFLRKRAEQEGNEFQIKTKKKRITNEPKEKVIIIDNKKYKTLKRQASQLQKQIKKGDKIKEKIQSGSLEKNKSLSRVSSLSKIKSVGMTKGLNRADSLNKIKNSVPRPQTKQSKQDRLKNIYMRGRNLPQTK